jgi:hypothetical protein
MLYVHIMVASYVKGIAVNLEWEAEAEQYTGMTAEQWMEIQSPAIESIMTSGDLSTFSSVITQSDLDFDLNLDTLFEFGLQRLLDGLGVFVDGESSHGRAPASP